MCDYKPLDLELEDYEDECPECDICGEPMTMYRTNEEERYFCESCDDGLF